MKRGERDMPNVWKIFVHYTRKITRSLMTYTHARAWRGGERCTECWKPFPTLYFQKLTVDYPGR